MFELDARLQADTWVLGDLPLCRLLLSRDANYTWLILVPRREGISEIHELTAEDQLQLARETALLAQRLKGLLGADKMNVAALGNVVPQLHVHVVARYATDVAWPAPIWGKFPARPYDEAALAALKARLKSMSIEGLQWEEGV